MKLDELIKKLQNAQNKYGNCDVMINQLGGERMFLHSICIEDNIEYLDKADTCNRYELLLECDIESLGENKFICYEYPIHKEIDL